MPKQPNRWQVRWSFEPHRLSESHLQAAYETLVPRHVRVLHATPAQGVVDRRRAYEQPTQRRAG